VLLSVPLLLVGLGIFGITVFIALSLTTPAETPAARVATYIPDRRVSPGTYVRYRGMRQRLLSPLVHRILEAAAKTAPQRVRKTAAAELIMAGSTMSPTVFLGIRGLLMFGMPVLGALYVLTAAGQPTMVHWLVLLVSVFWGRRLPGLWLKRRIRRRQRMIDRRLPYSLDLMVACLEGGLSLDACLAKVAEQSEGPLAEEIRRALHEIALGRPAEDAIRDLGSRNGAPELKRLTENIVQAERMGISIAETLRQLAHDSRVRRRQNAEEMARKAPIKMVPVLIFCVLPALGIVVMVPAAILLVRTLAQATPQ
jgi:tight adherence protein C